MIKNINVLEYVLQFESLRSPLSDYYMRSGKYAALGYFSKENEAAGVMVYNIDSIFEIIYLKAKNDDDGIKRQLISELFKKAHSASGIRWRLLEGDSNASLANSLGFYCESVLNIFHVERQKGIGEVWEILQKNEKLYAILEKRGFEAKRFDELTKDELHQIRDNPDDEFESYFHPDQLMDNHCGVFSEEFSTAAVISGKVAAYSIVKKPDGKHCVFEVINVARSKRKTGAFIIAFLKPLRAMFDSDIEDCSFAIYENNREMLNMFKANFGKIVTSQTVQRNLICHTRHS